MLLLYYQFYFILFFFNCGINIQTERDQLKLQQLQTNNFFKQYDSFLFLAQLKDKQFVLHLFQNFKLVYYISVYFFQNLVFFVSYVVVVLPILFYFIFFQLRHKYLNRTRLVEITITSSK
eukprot:TRINITY_DN59573_c0_g1_i1.p3 TRINITY_DN59573_c0_g1~~TRINITY_DN59573_c0_g1_i1.p3  ORF type:complete len:120 (+),score=2.96 TRINITY_DN59573_c0_g1_i1:172-531(+)